TVRANVAMSGPVSVAFVGDTARLERRAELVVQG
ncbi:MAG: hypothetical protein JWO77_2172, partial [Ilumatobacteraceae bacterium]|nr:hypothetical protein [Ilumatobacteraceae bacterium]